MKGKVVKMERRGGPRRVPVDGGTLVLPPAALKDLPPDGMVGRFMGILALTFATPRGVVAVFLHDLAKRDVDSVLAGQRQQAETQLGSDYAGHRWWE